MEQQKEHEEMVKIAVYNGFSKEMDKKMKRFKAQQKIIESGLQEEEEDGAVQVSHLNLVDLAGSEHVDQTGAVGERLKEGCSINRSLFMLGHVISQLSEGQEHVSFRDSKLTRILQTSLGGNTHTAIICTVTPAVIDETISTLGFASRAANIKNKPLKNEVLTDAALLKRYARQIAKLQEELKKTKHSPKASEEIESKLEETQRHNQLLQQRIDLLQEKLIGFPLLDSNVSAVRRALRRRTWGGHTTKPRFSVHLPQTLNPIEEEYECLEQQAGEVFSRSVADFQYGEFETPLEEFELELIEAERHRYSSESLSSNEDSLVTIRKKGKTVSFADQSENKDIECQTVAVRTENETFSSESECLYCNKCKAERSTSKEVDCQTDRCHSDSVEPAVNTSLELISDDTSCKQCNKSETRVICRTDMKDTDCQTEAAVCARLSDHFTMETPPKILRERARYLEKEYNELLEFTKLEKQMICEEQLAALIRENDKLRRENQETRKTVTELESMYLDTNRALSLVQDENKQLKQKLENEVKKCSELSRNISTLNKIQEETNTKLKDSLALEKEMVAMATLLLNFAVAFNKTCDSEGWISASSVITAVLPKLSDAEAVFRCLVALGTVIWEAESIQADLISLIKSSQELKILLEKWVVSEKTENEKVNNCAAQILALINV